MSPAARAAQRPAVSVTDAISMMVGIVLGVGIFQTPPVAANVGSEAAVIGALP